MFKKIFVFDDETLFVLDIAKALRNLGCEVEVETDFNLAFEKIVKFKPELALIDIIVGEDTKGFQLAEKINKDLKLPIIFITANTNEDIFEKAKEYSPYEYIVKPIDIMRLKTTLSIAYEKYVKDIKIKESEEKYRSLFENMQEAFSYHEMLFDENGNPCDYVFLEVNQAFEKVTGLNGKEIIGKRVKEIIPELENYWIEFYGKVVLTGEPKYFTNYNKYTNRYYSVYAYTPQKNRFAVLFQDVTERIFVEEKLQQNVIELEAANEELKVLRDSLEERVNYLTKPEEKDFEPDIKNLFERDELMNFMNFLSEFWKISIIIFDKNYEKYLITSYTKNLYEIVKRKHERLIKCSNEQNFQNEIVYCSNTGLIEANIEIKIEEKLIGYCLFGQVKSDKADLTKFKNFLVENGYDENKVEEIIKEVPYLNESEFLRLKMFIEFILKSFSESAYFNVLQARLIDKVKKANEEIKTVKDRLKLLIDSSPVGFIQISENLEIEYINLQAEKLFGVEKEKWLGKNIQNVIIFKNEYLWNKIFSERLEFVKAAELKHLNKRINLRISEIKSTMSKISGYILYFEDITEIENLSLKADIEEKKFKEIFENSFSPIVLVKDEKIVLYNSAFLEFFKFDKNDRVYGKVIYELFYEDYKNLAVDILEKKLYKEKPLKINAVCIDQKEGEKIYVEIRISSLSTKKEDSEEALLIFYDVSESKNYQELLIKAMEEAEKANRLKSEFLAQISHEIRTPVYAILSFASLLKEEVYNKVSDETKEMFAHIENGSQRLIRTIDLIINAAQLQTKSYEVKNVKLDFTKDILSLAITELKFYARNRGIKINLINQIQNNEIYSDSYALMQIFLNLIDNAIKFSDGKDITIRSWEIDSVRIAVEVADQGVGISKEYLPYLFVPFSQEERGYTRKFEGNGLGLYIVKKYCDILGGEIKVESEKGKGSKFTVIFPR